MSEDFWAEGKKLNHINSSLQSTQYRDVDILDIDKLFLHAYIISSKFRGIYFAKYCGPGGGGEIWLLEKKKKNEDLGENNEKERKKGKRKEGEKTGPQKSAPLTEVALIERCPYGEVPLYFVSIKCPGLDEVNRLTS